MRLRQLGLECYGNFASAELALDPAPGCINLVVAPNGAGKSVLRQAISELLFGFHPQTQMGFQFDYTRMRLRAEAVMPDGEVTGFTRRKGRANTLVDAAGQPAGPSLAARLPMEADRKWLERLFVLDSAHLRAGGKALLQSDGDLADALLSGAGDLGSARALAATLARRRDEAAPERRSARTPFYEACDAWTASGTRLAEAVVRPPAIAEQEAARDGAQHDLTAANAREAEARAAAGRLARVRSTRRHLLALDTASAWLDLHPDAPVLPEGVGPALATARVAMEVAARDAEAARTQHAALAQQLGAVAVDEAVLADAHAIEALAAERARAEQSLQDIPIREAELAQAQAALVRLLRDLSSRRDPAEAASDIRAAADIAAARVLVTEATATAATHRAAGEAVEKLRAALDEATDDLAALPEPAATDALRTAYDEAVADGDAGRLAGQATQAEAAARVEVAACLARVPGWQGDAAGLAVLAAPGEATLARLDQALGQARTVATAATERREAAGRDLDATNRRLLDLVAARPLPDTAAIDAARQHRDRGWALVYARLAGQAQPDAEAAYAEGMPLPLAFERAVAAADALADRRIDEMERLAAAAELQRSLASQEMALALATDRLAAANAALSAAATDWAAAMAPIALPPTAGLAEARAWLEGRHAVIASVSEHSRAAAALAALTVRQGQLADQLAHAMGTQGDTLPRLTAAARHQREQADRTIGQRQSLTRSIATHRRDLARAEAALARATDALVLWQQGWAEALARLGRPADETPAATSAVLDRLIALPGAVEAADALHTRIAEMQAQLAAFARSCAAVAARLGEPAAEPMSAARRLAGRLSSALLAHAARDTLATQTDAALAAYRAAAEALAIAERALADAIRAAGAETLAEAERQVGLAAERAGHEADRATALLRLREDGEGLDQATLRREADAAPPETVAEQMRQAEAESEDARLAAQDAAAAIERAEGRLRLLAEGHGATAAAAARQAAAARIARVLDDALVQHLAAAMLEHALAQVEANTAANQRLLRIGDVFSRLTGGVYDRLSPADEDTESREHGRLIAHEAGGADKHIARLSEGTRDQLYLALRLVAIEDHVRAAPALPFVADDILQTFDDIRARAAMEALIGLSQHVQVIVLTHHPHLLDVAKGLPVHVQHL